jgi:hypothetical protein
MPRKASTVMEERLRFVGRLLDGEINVRCVPGIRDIPQDRLQDLQSVQRARLVRSHRPLAAAVRYANQLPQQVESLIVNLKRDKPHWGARKIRELLVRRLNGDVRVPTKSTIHAVLDRHGLVRRMSKRRHRATGTPLSRGVAPNDLWCADYKGEFRLGNRCWCYPLTVTDHASHSPGIVPKSFTYSIPSGRSAQSRGASGQPGVSPRSSERCARGGFSPSAW